MTIEIVFVIFTNFSIPAIISLCFCLVLKNQATQIAYYDSPDGGVRMVFGYVSQNARILICSSLFIGLSIPGTIATIMHFLDKKKSERSKGDEIKNHEMLSMIANAVILGIGAWCLLITAVSLNHQANQNCTVHITNQKAIDFLKKYASDGNWQNMLPASHFTSGGGAFQDFSLDRWNSFIITRFKCINVAADWFVTIVPAGIGSGLIGFGMFFLTLIGCQLCPPNYEKILDEKIEEFSKLFEKEQFSAEWKKLLSDGKPLSTLGFSSEQMHFLLESRHRVSNVLDAKMWWGDSPPYFA